MAVVINTTARGEIRTWVLSHRSQACYHKATATLYLDLKCVCVCVCVSTLRRAGPAYRYTIQPIFDNLTDGARCHIRRRRPTSPILFGLFYSVEVPSRGFESPVVRRRVRADAVDGADGGSRGSVVADYVSIEFDVGVRLADEFLLRASVTVAAQAVGGDRTVTGTVWNVDHDDDGDRRGSTTRFRVHEIAQSAAFVASVRPRRPFEVSTARWRRPPLGVADAGAASCDMSPSKLLPAEDADGDDEEHEDGQNPDRRQPQKVKAVIQERLSSDVKFRYYIMSAESPPYFRFTIPGKYKLHIDNTDKLLYFRL